MNLSETQGNLSQAALLRQRLFSLTHFNKTSEDNITNLDIVITPNEMNNKHGTGVLVKRIFTNEHEIFSIRSADHYGGDHQFGKMNIRLSHHNCTRAEFFANIISSLRGVTPKRVICIPYLTDDLQSAIAIKEIYGIPLCVYIMDDQNICLNNIPDILMREFLTKCSLRFTTHPEMRDAYEAKYGLKFWLLPAVIPDELILPISTSIKSNFLDKGVLVGSIWSSRWFEFLRETIKGSHSKIDWYGNPESPLFSFINSELERDGITSHGILTENILAQRLQEYPYAIVPTGILDKDEDRPDLGNLSLPGRLIFILATSHTPIIVLGSKNTSAAHFVKHFKIGVVTEYDSFSFQEAVKYVTDPINQAHMRKNAAVVAQAFSVKGIGDWIWQSLELNYPCDLRFENLFPYNSNFNNLSDIKNADAVISHVEVNNNHGVGVLLKRIFSNQSNILSIRSRDLYGGDHYFGKVSLSVSHQDSSRFEIFRHMVETLKNTTIKRILSIPFFPDDVLSTLVLKDLFNVPLCTYIMDDQNIYSSEIEDKLMQELLTKSSLRLAISSEIRDAYESKYGLKFYMLPPVVPNQLIRSDVVIPNSQQTGEKEGIIVGNIWGQSWLKLLRKTIRTSGLKLTWYGHVPQELEVYKEAIIEDGINVCGYLPEDDLATQLRNYSYTVLPTGMLDQEDDRHWIAKLSLPSRLPFILATSHTPIIVLGSPDTAAARFVKRFKIGVVAEYNPESFQEAVNYITQPEVQLSMRQHAAQIAPILAADGISDWIWQSLELGCAYDQRFEELLPRSFEDLS